MKEKTQNRMITLGLAVLFALLAIEALNRMFEITAS